ncbi:hypothetical protein DFH08DRAFT_799382 [Mycena albidolilacea]|uniref:DUF6533 domain-containing protein n=1 Tax=Mycena albidolilacea TaxID=1033008 RepID=A0AAD7ALA9_9AGAR|nr:hypothetical protein DFH08DRAFT_799382 [Mycena albidolilacea]
MDASEISTELIIADPRSRNVNYYLGAISFTLLFYDFLLTLDWEISRYWGARISLSKFLFFLNRYGTLLGNIPVVVQRFWITPSSPEKTTMYSLHQFRAKTLLTAFLFRCRQLEYYHQWFIIATQMIIGVILILRTYALYERNNRVLGLVLVISAGAIGACIWGIIFSGKTVKLWPGANLPIDIGCTYEIIPAQSTGLIIAWASMGVFDCLIFFLTLYKALSRQYSTGAQLLNVLLRDGSIYFGVVLLANVSNILTFIMGGPYTRGAAATPTNIISSIIISRHMLNLRDPALSSSRLPTNRNVQSQDQGVFSTYIVPTELPTVYTVEWP